MKYDPLNTFNWNNFPIHSISFYAIDSTLFESSIYLHKKMFTFRFLAMIRTVNFEEPEKQERLKAIFKDFDFEGEYIWMK